MFANIRKRIESMGTIKSLCEQAERHALNDGRVEPGAEDFVLAAIDLPDGTAKSAFAAVGAEAAAFRDAVQAQYEEALRAIGLAPQAMGRGVSSDDAVDEARGAYSAAASGRAVMQALAAGRKDHEPLVGAHVIAVVADMEQGVAARALRVMGVDRVALKRAAQEAARNSSAH